MTDINEDFVLQQIKQKKNSLLVAQNRSAMRPRKRVDRLRSDRNISFDEFISILVELVEKAFREDGTKMSPDEGAIINDREKEINHPYIFFKIVDGVPENELKPRIMEDRIRRAKSQQDYIPDDKYPVEKNIEEEGIEVYRHAFRYTIQFDIFATSYSQANDVLNEFETLMVDYTGYLKQNGVTELLFKERLTDASYSQYREKYSVRSVRYTLKIDKIHVVTHKLIERLLNLDKQ